MSMATLFGWLGRLLGSSIPRVGPAQSKGEPLVLPMDAILIDARSEVEFASGHIEGAVSLPVDKVQAGIVRLVPDLDRPLWLYCRSGARSGRACRILAGMGYRVITNGGGLESLAIRLDRQITRPGR
jgi:phage shock protein E